MQTNLIALRVLTGEYGTVQDGQLFSVDEEDALLLEARGLAKRFRPPAAPDANSFKMNFPYENKALQAQPAVTVPLRRK